MFVDTHCHLYEEYYSDMDELEKRIKNNKVIKVINNGCDSKSNMEILELIAKYDYMYGALGIHPESADTYTLTDLEFIEKHINDNKVVAIGEIGLDYHYGKENRDKQIELFEYQLAMAERVNKPVIIHSRDATLDTIEILKRHHVKGVIHSFSGSYETACIYVNMGFLLGINGVITFKNCNLKDVVANIDLKNIVLETDSPYLTPVPYRGKTNSPEHIIDIANFIAKIKDISVEDLAEETNGNVLRCFDI